LRISSIKVDSSHRVQLRVPGCRATGCAVVRMIREPFNISDSIDVSQLGDDTVGCASGDFKGGSCCDNTNIRCSAIRRGLANKCIVDVGISATDVASREDSFARVD